MEEGRGSGDSSNIKKKIQCGKNNPRVNRVTLWVGGWRRGAMGKALVMGIGGIRGGWFKKRGAANSCNRKRIEINQTGNSDRGDLGTIL